MLEDSILAIFKGCWKTPGRCLNKTNTISAMFLLAGCDENLENEAISQTTFSQTQTGATDPVKHFYFDSQFAVMRKFPVTEA
jgi:hypothetical protein